MTDTAIQTRQPSGMEPTNQSHMQLIQKGYEVAIQNGAAMEVVQSILAEMRLQRDREEREAFNAALRRIQSKLKTISKRGWNPDTQSNFATTEDIDNEIQSLLQEEGMSLSFVPNTSDKPDMVLIVGTLSLGAYSREYPLEMPADGKGAKGGGVMSRTHATGSAITYGKRYLKNMIFDLRFKEIDNDGNKASISESMLKSWTDKLAKAKDMTEANAISLDAIRAVRGDTKSVQAIGQAKNKRIKELREENNA